MLRQVLQEIETTRSALHLGELSHRLGIDRSVLDGMIHFWVQKGRLVDDDTGIIASTNICTSASCKMSCDGMANCPFIAKMPKTYHAPKDSSS